MAGLSSTIGPLVRRVTEFGQRLRVTVTPHHFYSEYPDLAWLRRETYWREPLSLEGIAGVDLGPQLDFVRRTTAPFARELAGGDIHERAVDENGVMGFGQIEAEFLYCVVRATRPARVVQVGCGVSTSVMLRAAADAGVPIDIACVEPFPTAWLAAAGAAGRLRLVQDFAQKVPLDRLTDLDAGDLLFVDSTHTAKLGSEVVRVILEVLPRLAAGVVVHFHDICFPFDYPPRVLRDELFFNREPALLAAFLAMNPSYRITASLSMLHHGAQAGLQEIFPHYRPCRLQNAELVADGHMPSSIYLTRVT